MELNQIEELTAEIPAEQRKAVLKLIDLKTNEDMKEVINSIKHLESSNNAKFNAIESQIRILIWVIGFLASLLVALALKFIKY